MRARTFVVGRHTAPSGAVPQPVLARRERLEPQDRASAGERLQFLGGAPMHEAGAFQRGQQFGGAGAGFGITERGGDEHADVTGGSVGGWPQSPVGGTANRARRSGTYLTDTAAAVPSAT